MGRLRQQAVLLHLQADIPRDLGALGVVNHGGLHDGVFRESLHDGVFRSGIHRAGFLFGGSIRGEWKLEFDLSGLFLMQVYRTDAECIIPP
jgi:hypothetical protein